MSRMSGAIRWFQSTFGDSIASVLEGTPFTRDLVTALAMQETFYLWGDLYRRRPVDEVLALCAGDTLDAPNRSAFPKRRADLLAAKGGKEMFALAR